MSMKSTYFIRRSRVEDIPLLAEIERAADQLFPPGRLPVEGTTLSPEHLEQARAEGLLLVAHRGEVVVGYAACTMQGDVMHLHQVAVLPKHGRQGLGGRLVEAMLAEARSRSARGVMLTTFSDIPWNAPFYQALGFRVMQGADIHPALRASLAQEERLGMTNRVAMVYDVA